MKLYEVLSLIIGVAMAGLVIWQIRVATLTIKADHERRRKQATIDFMLQVRPIWQESQRLLDERFGEGTLSGEALEEIQKNRDARDVISRLLGNLEHLAVGVNTGVFDRELLFRTSASFISKIYHRLRPHIKKVQSGLPTAYIEFEQLAVGFEDRRRIKPPRSGDIVHS